MIDNLNDYDWMPEMSKFLYEMNPNYVPNYTDNLTEEGQATHRKNLEAHGKVTSYLATQAIAPGDDFPEDGPGDAPSEWIRAEIPEPEFNEPIQTNDTRQNLRDPEIKQEPDYGQAPQADQGQTLAQPDLDLHFDSKPGSKDESSEDSDDAVQRSMDRILNEPRPDKAWQMLEQSVHERDAEALLDLSESLSWDVVTSEQVQLGALRSLNLIDRIASNSLSSSMNKFKSINSLKRKVGDQLLGSPRIIEPSPSEAEATERTWREAKRRMIDEKSPEQPASQSEKEQPPSDSESSRSESQSVDSTEGLTHEQLVAREVEAARKRIGWRVYEEDGFTNIERREPGASTPDSTPATSEKSEQPIVTNSDPIEDSDEEDALERDDAEKLLNDDDEIVQDPYFPHPDKFDGIHELDKLNNPLPEPMAKLDVLDVTMKERRKLLTPELVKKFGLVNDEGFVARAKANKTLHVIDDTLRRLVVRRGSPEDTLVQTTHPSPCRRRVFGCVGQRESRILATIGSHEKYAV